MALLSQRGMKGNWQNVCYQRNTNSASIATEGLFQESKREAYEWSFAMFLEMHDICHASLAGPRYPGPHEAGSKRKLQLGGSCLDDNFLMG